MRKSPLAYFPFRSGRKRGTYNYRITTEEEGLRKKNMSSTFDKRAIETKIIEALRKCFDPEIPVNIYDLGLIYGIDIDDAGKVKIKMTLTSPCCPVAGSLPADVEAKVQSIPEVSDVDVELVWEPTWSDSMMSEAAKLQLG